MALVLPALPLPPLGLRSLICFLISMEWPRGMPSFMSWSCISFSSTSSYFSSISKLPKPAFCMIAV
jgi:hypothetical protein